MYVADGESVSLELTETDDAWVDVHDEMFWLKDGKHFTWISDRDGWRHVYLASLEGGETRLLTPGQFDVVELLQVSETDGCVYFIASPDNATERYLYRVSLAGGDPERLTPAGVCRGA